MPKIPDDILDCTFFLFNSREDAERGRDFGGTGFFVYLPYSNHPKRAIHLYAVTNWHVACRDGCSVIRLNTIDGGTEILDFDPSDWHFESGGHDIAVVPIEPSGRHKFKAIPAHLFLQPETREIEPVGVGDDVFMVGRFVDHDGRSTNVPSVRFGHISMMPTPMLQPNQATRESYCLDMHTRTGFSGSPVFIYRTPGSDLAFAFKTGAGSTQSALLFLGLHWGQFPERWEVEGNVQGPGAFVRGASGMTCICPASALAALLNLSPLVERRLSNEAKLLT